jgi:hypothetical protein
LGQPQPFIAVLPQECAADLHILGRPNTLLAHRTGTSSPRRAPRAWRPCSTSRCPYDTSIDFVITTAQHSHRLDYDSSARPPLWSRLRLRGGAEQRGRAPGGRAHRRGGPRPARAGLRGPHPYHPARSVSSKCSSLGQFRAVQTGARSFLNRATQHRTAVNAPRAPPQVYKGGQTAAKFASLIPILDRDAPPGPGPPGAFKRPQRFPMYIGFLWRFCMGARGA